MKATISITQQCNLRCKYCYIDKHDSVMSLETAAKVVDFMFKQCPPGDRIEIGFFGGEPLTEFDLLKQCFSLIELNPSYDPERVEVAIITNGTIFSEEIARFIDRNNITLCISCDGPPDIQNRFRAFPNGNKSAWIVEQNIRRALAAGSAVLVNAVYTPETLPHLPNVVDYFSSLGLRKIYLNPDYSAQWTEGHLPLLASAYDQVAQKYVGFHLEGDPHFISLVDNKLAVILRNGYSPLERCSMGRGEFAFTPKGHIYPCERLIGRDDGHGHCIGNVFAGIDPVALKCKTSTEARNGECVECSLNAYCMNWCGCSNYFSGGRYDRVGAFLCASEKAAISSAFTAFEVLSEKLGTALINRVAHSCCT